MGMYGMHPNRANRAVGSSFDVGNVSNRRASRCGFLIEQKKRRCARSKETIPLFGIGVTLGSVISVSSLILCPVNSFEMGPAASRSRWTDLVTGRAGI